jgi:hypothetical protein
LGRTLRDELGAERRTEHRAHRFDGARGELADGRDAAVGEMPAGHRSDAPEQADRQWFQEVELRAGLDDDDAVGLRDL